MTPKGFSVVQEVEYQAVAEAFHDPWVERAMLLSRHSNQVAEMAMTLMTTRY